MAYKDAKTEVCPQCDGKRVIIHTVNWNNDGNGGVKFSHPCAWAFCITCGSVKAPSCGEGGECDIFGEDFKNF